jgi:hypothetical protein
MDIRSELESSRLQILPNFPWHLRVWVCPVLLKLRMALRQKPASRAVCNLSGVKSGSAIGKMLSTARRNVSQNDQAHSLHSL